MHPRRYTTRALVLVSMGLLCVLVPPAVGQAQTFTSTSGSGTASASASSSSSSGSGSSPSPTAFSPPPPSTPPVPPTQPAPQTQTQTQSLPPNVTAVSLCAPINTRIVPNDTANSSVTITAQQGIMEHIDIAVNPDGLLSISISGPFETNQTIELTITLPSQALNAINHQGPGSEIYVAPGFQVQNLKVTTAYGAGRLYINNINATNVNILDHGLGSVTVTGSLGSVAAASDSLAPLYLSGVQKNADLYLWSTSQAYVEQSPSSTISGQSRGLNTIFYTLGSCNVTSPLSIAFPGLSLSSCVQQSIVTIPLPSPTWTCGLRVQGNFTCEAGASVLSLSSSGTAISGAGAPTLISNTPGQYYFSGPSPASGINNATGTQMQTGSATPGSANAASSISGSGAVSASSSSSSGPSGSSSTTQTTQNGVSQGFTTSSGGQAQNFGSNDSGNGNSASGVLVNYGGSNSTAIGLNVNCEAQLSGVRMPL